MGTRAIFKLAYFLSIIFTLFLTTITIAGAFAKQCDPNEYPLMAYIGLMLPGLLIISILIALYWAFRLKLWVWFSIVAIGANYSYLISMFQYSSVKQPKGKTIKIATYNIHSFNNEPTGYFAKKIANYMLNENVDILCFQEFNSNKNFNLDSLYHTFEKYNYKYVPTLPTGGTRIAIFSRYPLTDSLFTSFPNTSNCGMWVDATVNNKTVRIFNVHMQTTSLNRERAEIAKKMVSDDTEEEAKAFESLNRSLIDNIKVRANQSKVIRTQIDSTDTPILFCGDFNDTPASFTYYELLGQLQDGFKSCGKGYGYTFNGIYSLLRIDYIFHSDAIKGINYYSPSLKWSDHNPVIMEMEMD